MKRSVVTIPGYANQYIQKIGFGEPSKAPVVPAGCLLKFVPELVRNKKICRSPPAIGFRKSGKAYFELPGSLKYINEGRIRFKQKMPVFEDRKPIGAPPAVEEFLNKHMKLFQDGVLVFLDGVLVFRDGKPIGCEKHGAPPVIGFGESSKAPVVPAGHLLKSVPKPVRDRKTSFGIAGQLKYVNERRIIYRRKIPEFQDGKPIGAPPWVGEFLTEHMKLFQDGIIVFLDGELVFRDEKPVGCEKHGAPPVIGFGESGKTPVVLAGHLLKSVPEPVRDRKTSFGIAGQLKYVNEGRIIYRRWRVSNRTHEVIPRREDRIPRWGARIPRREARSTREARNSTGSSCSL
ncbi:hypothetical protein LWI29_023830 [Acer saccharum]|uniref:Uncharacterized protein n=1 Tax=Acer saccharum TaxID=4024 RepID=A0AA39SLQ7_ACESA|nr:hypothetical protein LWI29_023830 [Acer saccharum]